MPIRPGPSRCRTISPASRIGRHQHAGRQPVEVVEARWRGRSILRDRPTSEATRKSVSNVLPPMMPPTASCSAPRRTATSVVTSSGSDVTTAVMQRADEARRQPKRVMKVAADLADDPAAAAHHDHEALQRSARAAGRRPAARRSSCGFVMPRLARLDGPPHRRFGDLRGELDAAEIGKEHDQRDRMDAEIGDLRPGHGAKRQAQQDRSA